jgi:hypothetical protein
MRLTGMTDRPAARDNPIRRGASRRGVSIAIAALALALSLPGTRALRAAESSSKASTSAAARADAAKSIPLDRIDEQHRAAVAKAVKNAGIFRRMPVSTVDCDPDLYLFLVRNPEVIVNIWQVMNVTTVTTDRVKPGQYRASDGAGTSCTIEYVYSSPDTQVIVADGAYSGPLFLRPVKARCVMVLKSAYAKEKDGRTYVTSRMDTFIDLDSAGVELLARTVQPLVGRAADHNFTETSNFIGALSRASERNKPGVERLTKKLTKIDGKVRDEFLKLAQAIPDARDEESPGETVIVTDSADAGTRTANSTPVGRPIPPRASPSPATPPRSIAPARQQPPQPTPLQPRRLR